MVSQLPRNLFKSLKSKVVKRTVRAPALEERVDVMSAELKAYRQLLEEQNRYLKDLRWEAQQNRKHQNAMWLAATSEVCNAVEEFTAERQMDLMETVRTLSSSETSFARFGDGELRIMLRQSFNIRFQKNSPALREALRGLFDSPREDLLLGFPAVYRDLHGSSVWADIWPQLQPIAEQVPVFGNSHVSRPLFFQQYGESGVEAWRRVWDGADLCVVTGRGSRYTAVPELFSSAASIRRVDSAPTNAFDDLDRLLSDGVIGKADIVLVSLGPAGTVLTARLADRGQRVIDIGHISDSYLNVFEGSAWPESKPVQL